MIDVVIGVVVMIGFGLVASAVRRWRGLLDDWRTSGRAADAVLGPRELHTGPARRRYRALAARRVDPVLAYLVYRAERRRSR